MTDYVETAQRVIPRRTFHNGHLSEGLANILREIGSLNRAACAQSFARTFSAGSFMKSLVFRRVHNILTGWGRRRIFSGCELQPHTRLGAEVFCGRSMAAHSMIVAQYVFRRFHAPSAVNRSCSQ